MAGLLEPGESVRLPESPHLWRVVTVDHVRGWATIVRADGDWLSVLPISIAALTRATFAAPDADGG